MATEPASAYDHCQRIAKENARNFYYAFRTLPYAKRRAVYAVYAFCRICDDIADGDLPLSEKRRKLALVRQRLHSDGAASDAPPIFRALHHATRAYGIPTEYYENIVKGVETDLVKNRFADFDELYEYCYKVAAVVGLICVEVFGYDEPAAREYAVDMGIAMQLTNILRDVKEDAERDRIYLPQDDMRRFNYTEAELKRGEITDGFRVLMAHHTARARSFFESSERLFPLISPDARACPKVMHATYRGILDRIERADYDVFQARIGLSAPEKVLLMGRLWAASLAPMLVSSSGRIRRGR